MALKSYTHTDGRTLFLGKQPTVFSSSTPLFETYLLKIIPPPPSTMDWYKGVTWWTEMGNDVAGDCVFATDGHAIQVCSLNTTGEVTLSAGTLLGYYSKWDGYNPSNPNTDNGAVILTTLQEWHKQTIAGHKLLAYASIKPKNDTHVQQAISAFGVVSIGLQLPLTAQAQIGGTWAVNGDYTDPSSPAYPGSWGGHNVVCGKYTVAADGTVVYEPITWGMNQLMTDQFKNVYADEMYCLLLGSFFDSTLMTPSGYDYAQLITDMPAIAS